MRFGPGSFIAMIVFATAVSGCAVGRGPARIDSDDPAVQLPAMVEAGDRRGKPHDRDLPPLVDALDDEDAAVRLFAIESLEKLTGETLGYHYYASARSRTAAIKRWREYLATGNVPATMPESTEPALTPSTSTQPVDGPPAVDPPTTTRPASISLPSTSDN